MMMERCIQRTREARPEAVRGEEYTPERKPQTGARPRITSTED